MIAINTVSMCRSSIELISGVPYQVAVIEGTFLGIEFLSSRRGGRGGVIINVSSMGGEEVPGTLCPVCVSSLPSSLPQESTPCRLHLHTVLQNMV